MVQYDVSVKANGRSVQVTTDSGVSYRDLFRRCGIELPPRWEEDYYPSRARSTFQFSDKLGDPIDGGNTITLKRKR